MVGLVSLAVAMGIGRFAFTPLLPLMLRDGDIDAAGGAQWAMANYAGYLVGALSSARLGGDPRRGVLVGLLGVVLTTMMVGLLASPWLFWGGLILRTAAGVFSAWTLVCVSSWCLSALARAGALHWGAGVYAGVGAGIAVTGLLAWLGGQQRASLLWLAQGVVAALGLGLVIWGLRRWAALRSCEANARGAETSQARAAHRSVGAGAVAGSTPVAGSRDHRLHRKLVLCYGSFGFGYIVQATFLPAMAREQVPDPLVFGLTWPVFGAAAAASVMGAGRLFARTPRQGLWALAQALMAVGTALPLVTRSLGALAASALLVGGTFMVSTMAGMQLARASTPEDPTPLLARMTVAFALGQIAGPTLVWAVRQALPGTDPLVLANAVATLLLAGTAVWLARGVSEAH